MTRCLHLLDYRVYRSANLHTCVLRCECLRFITFLNHNLKKRNTARKLLRNHISRAVLLTVGTLGTNLCPQMRFCDLAASLLKLHNVPRQVKKTNDQLLVSPWRGTTQPLLGLFQPVKTSAAASENTACVCVCKKRAFWSSNFYARLGVNLQLHMFFCVFAQHNYCKKRFQK